ncbi:MAG: preprotein translocase subunit SecE [Patescibacteria group bacterium]
MRNNKIIKYISDSYQELLKVTWPTRNGLIKDTAIVIISSVVITATLAVIDLGLTKTLEYLISLKG